MSMPTRRVGRPAKGEAALLGPITLRFPKPVLEEIRAIVAERAAIDGADQSTVVRELVSKALAMERLAKGRTRQTK